VPPWRVAALLYFTLLYFTLLYFTLLVGLVGAAEVLVCSVLQQPVAEMCHYVKRLLPMQIPNLESHS
jgi:hypothetical protein